MKRQLFLLPIIYFISISFIFSNGRNDRQRSSAEKSAERSMIIDQNDTVVFDLSQATVNGNVLEFPVSILSDDTIYALDFSLKYDHTKLAYDTILNKTTYMSALAYYNTNDSTVRFTSNSSHRYVNDTILLTIRFFILSGPLVESDLNTIAAYLNGDPCSVKVTNYLINTMGSPVNEKSSFETYPNPVSNQLVIHTSEQGLFQLTDLSGRILLMQQKNLTTVDEIIDLGNVAEGSYLARFIVNNRIYVKKVIVSSH